MPPKAKSQSITPTSRGDGTSMVPVRRIARSQATSKARGSRAGTSHFTSHDCSLPGCLGMVAAGTEALLLAAGCCGLFSALGGEALRRAADSNVDRDMAEFLGRAVKQGAGVRVRGPAR